MSNKYSGITEHNKAAFDAIVPRVNEAITKGLIEIPTGGTQWYSHLIMISCTLTDSQQEEHECVIQVTIISTDNSDLSTNSNLYYVGAAMRAGFYNPPGKVYICCNFETPSMGVEIDDILYKSLQRTTFTKATVGTIEVSANYPGADIKIELYQPDAIDLTTGLRVSRTKVSGITTSNLTATDTVTPLRGN